MTGVRLPEKLLHIWTDTLDRYKISFSPFVLLLPFFFLTRVFYHYYYYMLLFPYNTLLSFPISFISGLVHVHKGKAGEGEIPSCGLRGWRRSLKNFFRLYSFLYAGISFPPILSGASVHISIAIIRADRYQ